MTEGWNGQTSYSSQYLYGMATEREKGMINGYQLIRKIIEEHITILYRDIEKRVRKNE
jgi:hypothetical protein